MAVALAYAPAAFAATTDAFAEHLLNRVTHPTPAAWQPGRLVIGGGNEVRSVAFRGGGDAGLRVTADAAVLRVALDERRQRLWVLSIGTLVVFDSVSGHSLRTVALPNWFYAGHGTNCQPDLRIDGAGGAIVSSNVRPKLWIVDGRDFTVREREVKLDSDTQLDAGFSALAIGDGAIFGAMAAPGTLWRINVATFSAEKLPVNVRLYGACAMETFGAGRPGEFTVFALSARGRRMAVQRIDKVAASRQAYAHDVVPVVHGPAGLVAGRGGVYLARRDGQRAWVIEALARSD